MAKRVAGFVSVLGLGLVGLVGAPPPGASGQPVHGDVVPGAYIVTVTPGVSPDDVARDHGRRLGATVDRVYRHAARGYAARMSSAAAARAAADARVRAVVQDRVVRIDAKPTRGGSGGQTVPTGVRRIGAVGKGAGVGVAVIDTGIDLDHPDLLVAPQSKNCSTGTSADDGNGHGSHVAGTIGAKDNTTGVVGVAPGTTVYAVRVLDNAGSGTWSSVICGIDWVTANAGALGIGVANMSLGGTGSERGCLDGGLQHAICDSVAAGVTYVVAAGNESDDAARHIPAAYDQVITVSALADFDGETGGNGKPTCRTDVDDTLADFSNYGADVDLIAPGVCINSTWKGGGYKTISGTSMASPHVAAAAALYRRANPAATPADVQQALVAGGTFDWTGDRDAFKEPLLNAAAL